MERTPSDFLRERKFPDPDVGSLHDAADALEAENAEAAKRNARSYLGQREFWTDVFADEPPQFLDRPLAECMSALQASIDGDREATSRIHRALHQIERQALPLSEKALLTIYQGTHEQAHAGI